MRQFWDLRWFWTIFRVTELSPPVSGCGVSIVGLDSTLGCRCVDELISTASSRAISSQENILCLYEATQLPIYPKATLIPAGTHYLATASNLSLFIPAQHQVPQIHKDLPISQVWDRKDEDASHHSSRIPHLPPLSPCPFDALSTQSS